MKTLGFFALAILFSIKLFSQDTLYTVDGRTILGKVTEITPDQIKYKKASNPDGPTYVVHKTEIALVHYKNGSKDVFGTGSGSSSASDDAYAGNSQNDLNNQPQTVVVNPRPAVNVVVGAVPFFAGWGWGGWGMGWSNWGWGWNRGWYGRPYHAYGYHRGGGFAHYGPRGGGGFHHR